MKNHNTIHNIFKSLPGEEQERLLDELCRDFEMKGQVLQNAKEELNRKRILKPCPHCSSEVVYRRGKQKGVQMYKCRQCGKWYSETTGTPLWDIKLKSKWQAYLRCMEQGMPIKKIANELQISIQTSFDWRHKILAALNELAPKSLGGVVECDELELSLNNKGDRKLKRKPRKRANDFKRNADEEGPTVVQVVTVVERGGEKYLRAVESKRLSKEEIQAALGDMLKEQTTLVTDKHPSYKSFARQNKQIRHKTILAKERVSAEDKSVHLQHVNNVHSQLRTFLRPFNGVSSKYLQNYLNWFAYKHKLTQAKKTIKQWFYAILTTPEAYELYLRFKDNAVIIRT